MDMIRWDGMHTVNLGVDLWVVASVMKKLFQYDVFGGLQMEESDRYLVAYDCFKSWSRTNKVWHSMPKFRPWRFRSKQHPWPELQSKAYNARCAVAWLCEETIGIAKQFPAGDEWLSLMASCLFHLAEWHRKSELLPRYLSESESKDMLDTCDQCCFYYGVLSKKAIHHDELLFPSRPKMHAWQEIAYIQAKECYNHRFHQGYQPEDFIGRMIVVCQAGNNTNVEFMGLKRFYLGQKSHYELDQWEAFSTDDDEMDALDDL
eukprot:s3511_g2.t1